MAALSRKWEMHTGENGAFGDNGRKSEESPNCQMRLKRDPFESGDFGKNGVFGENDRNGEQLPNC